MKSVLSLHMQLIRYNYGAGLHLPNSSLVIKVDEVEIQVQALKSYWFFLFLVLLLVSIN